MFNSNKILKSCNVVDNLDKARSNTHVDYFGNNLRDELLQQQILTNVAANIIAEPLLDGTGYKLELKSRNGQCVGDSAQIICNAEGAKKLMAVKFITVTGTSPSGEQTLVFEFSNGERLTCNVSDLYTKLKTVQAQLTEVGTKVDKLATDLTYESSRAQLSEERIGAIADAAVAKVDYTADRELNESAHTTIQNQVSTESSARKEADNALGAQFESMEQELNTIKTRLVPPSPAELDTTYNLACLNGQVFWQKVLTE